MKDISLSIISYLKSDIPIVDMVGARIYRKLLPPNPTFPAIVVSKIDDLRGGDSSTGRYSVARIQCSCYAATDQPADELSELVANALNRTQNTVIGTVQVVGIDDAGTVPDSNLEVPVFIYHRDFLVEYSQKLTK